MISAISSSEGCIMKEGNIVRKIIRGPFGATIEIVFLLFACNKRFVAKRHFLNDKKFSVERVVLKV